MTEDLSKLPRKQRRALAKEKLKNFHQSKPLIEVKLAKDDHNYAKDIVTVINKLKQQYPSNNVVFKKILALLITYEGNEDMRKYINTFMDMFIQPFITNGKLPERKQAKQFGLLYGPDGKVVA